MIQSILKKIAVYTFVYLLVTVLVSIDEFLCAINLDTICLVSLVAKWFLFLVIMYIFDRVIKPLFQKKIDKK